MKKVIIVLVLATLIVGGVFAQRVGDTVQLLGQDYRVMEVSGGRVVLQKVERIDGNWISDGIDVSISGGTGTFTAIRGRAAWGIASNNGIISVGGPIFRNITQTGERTFSCQVYQVNANGTSATWMDCTLTLNAAGTTLSISIPGAPSSYRSGTFTKGR